MKVKLQNFSKSNQLLLLDVLDYLVDKGNMIIWSSISSKKFFQSLLDLLRTKDIPEVQMKLLGLIQKWGLNFEDKKNVLPNFYSVYNKLRNSNVQFPNDFESNYQIYISNSNSNNYNRNKSNYDNRNDEYENEDENNDKDEDGETFYYMESLKNKLKVPNFEHKYRRLVNFLVKMHDNIQMANLLMDSRERSGLKDIINTLREGNNTLIDTISGGRLKDEKLMEITLGTTEDINQTLNRDEDIKNGYKPKKFTSYFVLNNVIPIRSNNNYNRSRARSTKPKKSIQRRDERYKNYDMDLNEYDKNKYKEKMGGGPKNADDIFDLFSASNPSNEPGYNQQQNNQPINNFFSSQIQFRGNNNNTQYPQLRNNPMNNIFNTNRSTMMNNNNNNNNNTNFFNNNNFQGDNMNNNNNNFGRQFNQNSNQQRPIMSNFDILEQKLNNLNIEQNNNNFNFTSQSTQFNQGFNNNNNNFNYNNNNNNNTNTNNNNNNNNNSLMTMLDQLGPSPQGNSNQLVPYIGSFNNNNNNNNNQFNNFGNNNNNNQFNNFNNNNNSNQFNNNNNQFNNFNNNNNNNQFNNNNNQFNNFNNNNNPNNNFGNNNNGNMFNMQSSNNQINLDTNLGRSQNMNNNNMNNNNFGMSQNNNQQMNLEDLEKQQKLKELDDLF